MTHVHVTFDLCIYNCFISIAGYDFKAITNNMTSGIHHIEFNLDHIREQGALMSEQTRG